MAGQNKHKHIIKKSLFNCSDNRGCTVHCLLTASLMIVSVVFAFVFATTFLEVKINIVI